MLDLTATFTPFPILETERCILRAPTADGLASLFALWGSPEVSRYLGRPQTASLEEARTRLEILQGAYQNQTSILWAVTSRAENRVIGTVLLMNFQRQHHRAELGYELIPDWWGKGL